MKKQRLDGSYCRCRDCRRMKRRGFILGRYIERGRMGPMFVSGYVWFPRYNKGKKPNEIKGLYDC